MNAQPARAYLGIGEVLAALRAEFPDISVSKIRFLESEGLIEPARSPSGYRRFAAADIDRLRYILAAQRDQYLPLRVIRERLAPAGPSGAGPAARTEPATARPALLSRRELLQATGLDEARLTELESFDLVRRTGRQYAPEAVQAAASVSALAGYGVQARHLRGVQAAVEREISLIEQVVAPTLGKRTAASRQEAARAAGEIAALSLRLHAALLAAALAEAGLTPPGPPAGGLADGGLTGGGRPGKGPAGRDGRGYGGASA